MAYVNVASMGGGSVSPAGRNYVADGGSLKMYAYPDDGYEFSYWSCTGSWTGTSYVQNPTTSGVTGTENWKCYFKKKSVTTYTVSVSAGTGGSVSPSGNQSVASGGSLKMTATANSGYTFEKWTGSWSGTSGWTTTTNPFTSTNITSNETWKASFTKDTVYYTVTATAGSNGSVSGGGSYAEGSTCTLTASPNTGYVVDYWESGSITIDDRTSISFIVGSSSTWKVYFKKASYTITLANDGHGYVTKSSSTTTAITSDTYSHGSSFTFYARPNSGYNFDYWSVSSSSFTTTTNPPSGEGVYADQNETWTAHFKEKPKYDYYLRFNANGGSGVPSTLDDEGTTRTSSNFTIPDTTPTKSGCNFLGWSFSSTATSASYTAGSTVTLYSSNPDRTLYAVWQTIYYFKANAGTGGSVTPSTSQSSDTNEFVVTASASEGYKFVKWEKDLGTVNYFSGYSATSPTIKISVDYNSTTKTYYASLNAVFEEKTKYTLSINANPTSGGSPSGGGTSYNNTFSIKANPDTDNHYHFKEWTVNGQSPLTIASLTSANTTATFSSGGTGYITAWYEEDTKYYVTVSPNNVDYGTVTTSAKESYTNEFTLTATPKSGYTFFKWQLGTTGGSFSYVTGYSATSNPTKIKVNYNSVSKSYWADIIGKFGVAKTVTVTSNNTEYGTVSGGGTYAVGDTVILTASPIGNATFEYWQQGHTSVSTNTTYSFTMPSYNVNYKGYFKNDSAYPFYPRTDDNLLNKYYIGDQDTRYSERYNPFNDAYNPITTPSIIGNCTWYAQGRSAEIAGQDLRAELPNLGNAGSWFGNGACSWGREGYDSPSSHAGESINFYPGDILCWTGTGDYYAGHVEIVEAVDGNTLTISYSDYGSVKWGTYTTTKPTINAAYPRGNISNLRFQGAIHNAYRGNPSPPAPGPSDLPVSLTLIASPSEGGSVGGGTAGAPIGTVIHIQAFPNDGYDFDGWSDGSLLLERDITLNSSMTLTATFKIQRFTITTEVSPENSGSVSGGGTYDYGTITQLTATPNKNYAFLQWSDGDISNPRDIQVFANATYTAEFEKKLSIRYGTITIVRVCLGDTEITSVPWGDLPMGG